MGTDLKARKILVAISGGIDSAVTACLLKNQGYQVLGIHLNLWNPNELAGCPSASGRCGGSADSDDAKRVCRELDIPYFEIDGRELFMDRVIDRFVHEQLQQHAASPCIYCNKSLKFGLLYEKAAEMGCDLVATGHYAQIVADQTEKLCRLFKSLEPDKDQSYSLFGLSQAILSKTMFPLGGLPRSMIKKLGEQAGLNKIARPACGYDEICFVRPETKKVLIEARVAPSLRAKGITKTVDDMVVGQHNGLYQYSLGQKTGLDLSLKSPEQFCVVDFDIVRQVLIVGEEAKLYHKDVLATQTNWIRPVNGLKGFNCLAKLGPQAVEVPCRVTVFENDTVRVEFTKPQRAISTGQIIAFYDGEEVLGGAFVEQAGAI